MSRTVLEKIAKKAADSQRWKRRNGLYFSVGAVIMIANYILK